MKHRVVLPVTYRVLKINELSAADRDYVVNALLDICTGDEARQISGTGYWTSEKLDHRGRVTLLKYKGTDVALFFKRDISEITPNPDDAIPQVILRDPEDAWTRLDLNLPSARQQRRLTLEKRNEVVSSLEEARKEIEMRNLSIRAYELEVQSLKAQVEELKAQLHSIPKKKTKSRDRELGQRDVLVQVFPILATVFRGTNEKHVQDKKIFNIMQSYANELLDKHDVQFVMPSQGARLDLKKHEVVQVNREFPEGKVFETLEPGYLYKGKLVRAARVVAGADKQRP